MAIRWPATWLAQGTASRSTTERQRNPRNGAEYGGRTAASPREAAAGAAAVFAVVGNDDDLRSVCWAPTARWRAWRPAACSSITPPHRRSRARTRCGSESACLAFVDAPVSGGQAGQSTAPSPSCAAAMSHVRGHPACGNGLCQGRDADRRFRRGQLAKMVNQICVTVWFRAAEAIAFGQKAGLE